MLTEPLHSRVESSDSIPVSSTSDSTFIARSIVNWQLLHELDFQSSYFRNCIDHLQEYQLDALFAHLQSVHTEYIEQIWAALVNRTEKLAVMMALLQLSFVSSIPLSIGSMLAGFFSARFQVHKLAKAFFNSSQFFGMASLAAAIGMGLAVGSCNRLLRESRVRTGAIGKVKETMEQIIRNVKDQRFRELVKAGIHVLRRQERRIARNEQILADDAGEIERLKRESVRQENQLTQNKDQLTQIKSQIAQDKSQIAQDKNQIAQLKEGLIAQENKLSDLSESINRITERLKSEQASRLGSAETSGIS